MTICALSSTSIFILSTDKQSSVRLNSRSSKLKDLTKSIRRRRDNAVRTRLNNSQFNSRCKHIPLQLRPQRYFPLPPPLFLPTYPLGMASAAKKSQASDASDPRLYKYAQEISQMMFVFGEVQDPNPETISLVEDIVRSQIIELVRVLQAYHSRIHPDRKCRSSRRVRLLTAEEPVTSPPKTSSSSFATTGPR